MQSNYGFTDETLYILSTRLHKVSTMDDVLQAIIAYPCQLNVSNVAIFGTDPSPHLVPQNLYVIAQWSSSNPPPTLDNLFKPFQANEVFEQFDGTVFVEDCTNSNTNAVLRRFLIEHNYGACVLVPLHVHGNWIGIICMVWKTMQTFDNTARHIFSAIGHQAAWVIYGVVLHAQIQERIRRTELLLRFSTKLSKARNEQEIVNAVGELVGGYGVANIVLSYIDTSEESIRYISVMARWSILPDAPTPKQLRFGKARPMPEFLNKFMDASAVEGVIFIDRLGITAQNSNPIHLERTGFTAETCAIVPLWQSTWQGVLSINWQQHHTFTEEEKEIFSALIQILRPIVASRRAYLAQAAAIQESEHRAKELEMVSKVSAAASQNLDFDQLLQTVVDLSQSRFNLYNAHIYLLDTQKQHLMLAATSGETGRTMKALGVTKLILARDPSIAARCARAKDGIIINDVTKSPDFIPNPLLPEVRSEMAVPMLLGNQLMGVLNFQSKEINYFTPNILLVMRALADEIAVAVRNVDLYQKQRIVAEELRKIDQLKSRFLANMSHELRTPLNAIRNFTYFVASGLFGPVNERQIDALGKVTQGTEHLLGLINDILDFSKIEAGMMQLYLEDIDLNPLLDDVFATVNGLPRSAQVKLVSDIEAALPTLRGDKQRIKQILLNLLSNAIKFTEKGMVTLLVRRNKQEILFSVSDTGSGIALEDQAVIFEAFRQTSDSVGHGGTGLGLPISKHLAEAHGGKLWLKSDPTKGSTFFLALPITKTDTAKKSD